MSSNTPILGSGGEINYVNPPNHALAGTRACIALLVIGYVAVAMKISLKATKKQRRWRLHDVFIVLGLIFSTATVVLMSVNVFRVGLGRHIWDVHPSNLDAVFRLIAQHDICYELAIIFIKLSILNLYLSIFSVKRGFRIATYFLMGFCVIYLAIFVLLDSFKCHPLREMWRPVTNAATLHCLNGPLEQKPFGIFNIVTDLTILVLPFPVILRLQMSKSRTIAVALIFSLGLFTVAAAITRTVSIWTSFGDTSDSTWTTVGEQIWTTLEMLVGLICGALLSSRAFLQYVKEETAIGRSLQTLITRHRSHDRLSDAEDGMKRPSGNESDDFGNQSAVSAGKSWVNGKTYELAQVRPAHAAQNYEDNNVPPMPSTGLSEIGVTKTVTVSPHER